MVVFWMDAGSRSFVALLEVTSRSIVLHAIVSLSCKGRVQDLSRRSRLRMHRDELIMLWSNPAKEGVALHESVTPGLRKSSRHPSQRR